MGGGGGYGGGYGGGGKHGGGGYRGGKHGGYKRKHWWGEGCVWQVIFILWWQDMSYDNFVRNFEYLIPPLLIILLY